MSDPSRQAAIQLANIETSSGTTLAEFCDDVARQGLTKHSQMMTYLKDQHGLTHGNANLIATLVREHLAGGALSSAELLDNQYSGRKAALRPIYEELASIAESLGDDVTTVVQKTGVSFRRSRQFARLEAPSSTAVRLGLKLDNAPSDPRLRGTGGMCSHSVDIDDIDDIDDSIASWIAVAYKAAAGHH